MEFKVDEKNVLQVGDIENNDVSIDAANINFIVTLLSTSLYSKPIESFIRETVSNAWDSHVEAKVSEPVILHLFKDSEEKMFCAIRDFGVGLSPERFDKIYRNIGSSTKRGDNEQIGGFGIGRFSALAYSNVVYITTNFEGKKYTYMMYKDGNSVSIPLLDTQDTEDTNGLEVRVPILQSDLRSFSDAIFNQLTYFENLFVIDDIKDSRVGDIGERFNDVVIKKYNNFYVHAYHHNSVDILLGKVRYPLRFDALTFPYMYHVKQFPISLIFNIGDLEITPNREEILYSKKNILKIEEVLNKSIEEIDEIATGYFKKDFKSIEEYVTAIESKKYFPLLKTDTHTLSTQIPNSKLDFTLNGVYYNIEIFNSVRNRILNLKCIPTPYVFYDGRISFKGKFEEINLSNLLGKFRGSTYISDVGSLSKITKDYIRETFPNNSIFLSKTIKLKYYYWKMLRNAVNDLPYNLRSRKDSVSDTSKIVRFLLSNYLKELSDVKFITDKSVTNEYLENRKEKLRIKKEENRLKKEKGLPMEEGINLDRVRASNRGYEKVTTEGEYYTFKNIYKTLKGLNIYDARNSEKLRNFYSIFKHNSDIRLFEVAPTKMKLLENLNNFVLIDDFFSVKYKIFRKIATARYIEINAPYVLKLSKVGNLNKISTNLSSIVKTLSEYYNQYNSKYRGSEELIEEIYQMCLENNYFDEEIKALLVENKTTLERAEFLCMLGDNYSSNIKPQLINLSVDYILARKLFRPDLSAVKKLRAETVYNKKIELKDENNSSAE